MKRLLFFASFAALATMGFGQSFFESFDNIGGATTNGQQAGANLEAGGWFFNNQSDARGLTDYFQGNLGVFPQQEGTGYMGANFNNTTGTNTINNWAILPVRTLRNGDTLDFWTRTVDSPAFPDRLQIRMSANGASTNTGTGGAGVGDFSNLLLDINPNYTLNGYPNVWTQFTATVVGLGGPTSGRLAFRYFVEQGGPTGANSDYIGIDAMQYTSAVPEPATMAVLGLGALAMVRRRNRK